MDMRPYMVDGVLHGLQAFGNVVAATPFERVSVEKKIAGGMVIPGQKVTLAALKLVFAAPKLSLKPGDVIYVVGERYTTPWGKLKYSLEESEFILVPENEILLIDRA